MSHPVPDSPAPGPARRPVVLILLALLCAAAGLVLLLGSRGRAWYLARQARQETEVFHRLTAPDPAGPTPGPYPRLQADMQSYNAALADNGQSGLTDAWSYEQAAVDLSAYGLSTEVVATLRLPALDQELPVYLGASTDHLAKGLAVLGQTSLPAGGPDTNCVLAGHRGYGGSPMLRDIQLLQPGDAVYLTNYWQTLEYRVESTAVILPQDVDAVRIQPGRDLLTLVTCHPYPEDTYRYVVYCQAAAPQGEAAPAAPATTAPPAPLPADQLQRQSTLLIRLQTWLPLAALPLLAALALLLWGALGRPPKHHKKELP